MSNVYETGTIRQTYERLQSEGMNISENTLRVWVRQGILTAAYSGKKAYIYYPNVLDLIKNGTPMPNASQKFHDIRKIV